MNAYYEEHEEDFEDRCLDRDVIEEDGAEEDELQWIALVDILINHAYCCELYQRYMGEDISTASNILGSEKI